MAVDAIIEALTSKQDWFVALRKCHMNGINRSRGEVFNIEDMRRDRVRSLEERRYLFMLPYGLKPPQEDADGRRWLPGYPASVEAPAPEQEAVSV